MKQLFPFSKTIFLAGLTFACLVQPAYAKKMYRWVDENGKVFFSDKVPPSQKHLKREVLDKNARVLEEVEKAKTKAQIEMDKRLRALRQQQEKLIAAQQKQDKVLLSTFRTIEDMKNSHEGKLKAMDGQRKISENNLERLQDQLAEQQKTAADYEINNQEIPEDLLKGIDESHKQIENTKEDIQKQIEQKQKLAKKFAADEARYMFLAGNKGKAKDSKTKSSEKEEKVSSQLGLFNCQDEKQCSQAWDAARKFVKEHSTTVISIDSDKLIMTQAPRTADDLSLSVSKMRLANKKIQIFLDIRCGETMEGKELCSNEKAQTLRIEFGESIKSALGLETDQQKREKAAKEAEAAATENTDQ